MSAAERGLRVTIYDKNPGPGAWQGFLALSWLVGCWLQKLFGAVDKFYGAKSWDDARAWLRAQPGKFESIQYWGHGSQGLVWLAGEGMNVAEWKNLKPQLTESTIIWFRVCSSFGGAAGHSFSQRMADVTGCTIGGHTRIIGLLQGGLHTRKPNSMPSWLVSEGEFPKSWLPAWLKWGSNTVTFLATKIPVGW